MLELLEKAQVFSLDLVGIAERTGLGLSRESLPQWKVEMAVEAARKFLTDIFVAMDYVAAITDKEMEILSWKNLLNLEQMRGALPVSIGLSLQSGRDIESLRREINSIRGRWVDEEALRRKAVGRRARSAGRRLLDNFLSGFREIAAGVTDKGYKSLRREEIRGKVEELIERYYPDFFASEPLRRHVVTVLTDILQLISFTPEEVRNAIDAGYKGMVKRL